MIRVTIEVDEGHIDHRVEFNDAYSDALQSATERVLALTASAETAMVAALNAKPREASPR